MENKKRKELIASILAVAALIIVVSGATFAYFAATVSGNNNVVAESYEFAVSLGVSKTAPTNATIDKLIPLKSGDISTAVTGYGDPTPQPCVDKNGYAACVIYTLTLTNSGSGTVTMDGTLTPATNQFSSGQLYYRVATENTGAAFAAATATRIVNSDLTTGFDNISVGTASPTTLYLMLYILDDESNDQPNNKGKTFSGRLTFTDKTSGSKLEATFS